MSADRGQSSEQVLAAVDPDGAAVRIRGAVLAETGAARPYAASRPIEIRDLVLDPPGVDEVLVRIEAASICHSDLSVVNGARPRPVPMLLGHEACGIVEGVGAGVDLELGQRVALTFLPRCGACAECETGGRLPCAAGSAANGAGTLMNGSVRLGSDAGRIAHHLGVSGFATHAVVDRRSVVAVDDDVPPEIAALLGCAVLTGGGALLNAVQIGANDTVAVVGLGGVGMAGLLTAKALGCKEIVAVDALAEKLALAVEWGADHALLPDEVAQSGIRADIVLEAGGHPRAFETAYRLMAPGGTLVTVGLPAPGETARIEPLLLTAQARTIVGSYLGSAVPSRDIPRLAELWRAGRLPLELLISDRITLDEINEGMDRLADGAALRQVITF